MIKSYSKQGEANLQRHLIIVANNAGGYLIQPTGMSGGDRILIEIILKRMRNLFRKILITSESGRRFFSNNSDLTILDSLYITQEKGTRKFDFLRYLLLILPVALKSFRAICREIYREKKPIIIYSASNFLEDFLPCFISKLVFRRRVKWVASFYIFPPNPLSLRTPYRGVHWRVRNLLFYFICMIQYPLINRKADMIWVTNELDALRFKSEKYSYTRVIPVKGGVDLALSTKNQAEEKKYDAVFVGRLHPQKGVLELIDIWRLVVAQKNDARLAIIGIGDAAYEQQVLHKIKQYGLERSVELMGYKDGEEKVRILKASRLFLHPVIHDSGGMAAAEAMSCGLPCVSFDLPSLRVYYPRGILRTPCFDLKSFAENILKLLNNKELYTKLQKEALELAKEWDWDKKAEELGKAVAFLIGDL